MVEAGRWLAYTTRCDLRDHPSVVVARLTALMLAVAAVAPFDVALSFNRLYAAVKQAHLVPFALSRELAGKVTAARSAADPDLAYHVLRDWWMLWLDYAAQIAGYALLGVLVTYYLRAHCRTSPGRARRWTIGAGSLLAAFITVARLFILSRGFDATYFVIGVVGVAGGAFLHGPIVRRWASGTDAATASVPRSRKHLIAAGLAAFVVFMVMRETAPFRPVLSDGSIADQTRITDWLPLETYQLALMPVAAEDLIGKLIRFGCLGIGLALWRATPPRTRPSSRPWATGLAVACLIALLEVYQLLQPSRIPALTDVLLAFAGTAGGVQAYRLSLAYYCDACRSAARASAPPVLYNVELGPPEEGPAETVPTRQSPSPRR
jgi:hypothetical protein